MFIASAPNEIDDMEWPVILVASKRNLDDKIKPNQLVDLHPVWPDLVKFHHFRKRLQVFGKFLTVYFLFGKMLSLLWQICDIIGLQMAKYWKII